MPSTAATTGTVATWRRLLFGSEQSQVAVPPLPDRRAGVTLVALGGEQIPARVLERGPQALVLVVMPLGGIAPEQLPGMTLEFRVPGAIVRLGGELSIPDPASPEVLLIEEPFLVEAVEQRASERVLAVRSVYLPPVGRRGALQAYTADLSTGGMLLDCADPLRHGERVRFELLLSRTQRPLAGSARVVRVEEQVLGRRALAFIELAGDGDARLAAFVSERVGVLGAQRT